MKNRTIKERYNDWIVGLACEWCNDHGSYEKILEYLHKTEFYSSIKRDKNRADDGVDFRMKYAEEMGIDKKLVQDDISGPATVLEVMVALAIRQEDILWDWNLGNRTGQWFYDMMESSHLDILDDYRYDEEEAEIIVKNILSRNYKKNGDGGLFTLYESGDDLRKVELWYQLMWHINELSN